jgi:adenylate kinase
MPWYPDASSLFPAFLFWEEQHEYSQQTTWRAVLSTKMAVLLVGCFGCGKGTHGLETSRELEIPYLDMGKTLRGMGKDDKAGGLSPIDTVRRVGSGFVMENQTASGIFLDGWPRNWDQAHEVVPFIEQMGFEDIRTMHFITSPEECIRRLTEKPRPGRDEDRDADKLARRLKAYQEETLPMIPFLMQRTKYVTIDNTGRDIVEVRAEFLHKLGLRPLGAVSPTKTVLV